MALSAMPADNFTDSELARPDHDWLKRLAGAIRHRLKKLQSHRIAVGLMLIRARTRLGGRSGAFGRWIALELGLSRSQATRFMRVWKTFGQLPVHVTQLFDPTALYTLAEKGTHPEAIKHFLTRALAGNFVRGSEVDQYIAGLRDAPIDTAELEAAIPKDPAPVVDAARVHAAENWFLLEKMIDHGHTLHLSTIVDEGDRLTTAFYLGPDRRPRNVTRPTAEECLVELADEQRAKKCNGPCGLSKPLTDFSKRVKNPDGRNDRCLKCEAARVREYKARRKRK